MPGRPSGTGCRRGEEVHVVAETKLLRAEIERYRERSQGPARIETEGEGQELARIREKVRKLGVTGKDVAAAIRWARKKR